MPPIIHDYPAIKKALLGDSWWTPAPAKPKPEAPKPEPAFFITYTQELVDALLDDLQDPTANTGRTLRIRLSPPKWESPDPSRPLIATTPFPPTTPSR